MRLDGRLSALAHASGLAVLAARMSAYAEKLASGKNVSTGYGTTNDLLGYINRYDALPELDRSRDPDYVEAIVYCKKLQVGASRKEISDAALFFEQLLQRQLDNFHKVQHS